MDMRTKYDIAERIAEAVARTTEPLQLRDERPVSEDETVLGNVPQHLRHLHNLIYELKDEAHEVEKKLHEANKCFHAVREVFFTALAEHIPSDDFDRVNICKDWQVTGWNDNEDEVDFEKVARLMLRRPR
jgi:hypothetical protein